MAGCDPMADPREESEPLLSRTRGGSARHSPAGVPSCHSIQVGPGEPRTGEGPGRAGVARGVPPARAASLLSLGARPAPPAGVRAGPGGAAAPCGPRPRPGRGLQPDTAGSRPAPDRSGSDASLSPGAASPLQPPRFARGLVLSVDRLGDS